MNFSKPALSLSEQIRRLRHRGLIINDPTAAEAFLTRVSYYRLSGYTRAFYCDELGVELHRFRPNTCFEDVVRLYEFDRDLRAAAMAAVERIEIALRTVATNHLCLRYGSLWFLNPNVFLPGFSRERFLANIEEAMGQDPYTSGRRESFLDHYFRKYTSPDMPPGWMVAEVLSFSTWSNVFKNLRDLRDQKEIAQSLGWAPPLLTSWVHCLSILRNCCAHHSRIWNRRYAIRPTFPAKDPTFASGVWKTDSFAAQAAVIHALHRHLAPNDNWVSALRALFHRYPQVQAGVMGFSFKWWEKSFWALTTRTPS